MENLYKEKFYYEISKLNNTQKEGFFLWCDYYHHDLYDDNLDINQIINDFLDCYIGFYHTDTDFGCEMAGENLCIPTEIEPYFDYEKYAKDLFTEDYISLDGHVFED